jgi:Ca2+-binding RTX toxin-like protein
MNKADSARPLDARPGQDPFGGQDRLYSCDGVHRRGKCQRRLVWGGGGLVISSVPGHNELLGGHGNDTINAGPWGDVIWGDYKPSGQPSSQVDHLYGGPGRDFIYASHGYNDIHTGGGNDVVHAHFGHGSVTCDGGDTVVYLSHHSRRLYSLQGCRRISYATVGH